MIASSCSLRAITGSDQWSVQSGRHIDRSRIRSRQARESGSFCGNTQTVYLKPPMASHERSTAVTQPHGTVRKLCAVTSCDLQRTALFWILHSANVAKPWISRLPGQVCVCTAHGTCSRQAHPASVFAERASLLTAHSLASIRGGLRHRDAESVNVQRALDAWRIIRKNFFVQKRFLDTRRYLALLVTLHSSPAAGVQALRFGDSESCLARSDFHPAGPLYEPNFPCSDFSAEGLSFGFGWQFFGHHLVSEYWKTICRRE